MTHQSGSFQELKNANTTVLRICDLCIALPLTLILIIPMALIALSIRIDDGGSIFFRQVRVGKGTKHFMIFKFRTMHMDKARIMGNEHLGIPSVEARALFQTTSVNDSRITRVGRVLRPTHLDELPQLFNVVLGDMSLVGVRPDVPVQEADYSPEVWQERHLLKPGMTGFAQVDGTIENTEQRTLQDLRWVRNASISAYFTTILKTFVKVLKRNSL